MRIRCVNKGLIGTAVQNFASFSRIATGIYGNDSKAIFEVEGSGEDQWVSFYHQSESSSSAAMTAVLLPTLTHPPRHRRHGLRRSA